MILNHKEKPNIRKLW